MPGTGRALAFAGRGNPSLLCHQDPGEEGEGRGSAFPVPPARLDLRGLRLPGNSRAAAGPGSARGLLGAGLERFGTTRPGKSLREGEAGALWAVGRAWSGGRDPDAGQLAWSETPTPGEVGWAAADSPAQPLCFSPAAGPCLPEPEPRAGPPLPFRRVRCPAQPGTTAGPREFWARSPGLAVLSGGLLWGMEACCFSSRTSPSS